MMDSLLTMNFLQQRAAMRQQKRANDVLRSKHIKDLFKYLERNEQKELNLKAKMIVKQCSLRRKIGDPNFKNMINTMEVLLRELVGEEIWEKATSASSSASVDASSVTSSTSTAGSIEQQQQAQQPLLPQLRPLTPPNDQQQQQQQQSSISFIIQNGLKVAVIKDVLHFLELTGSVVFLSEAKNIVTTAAEQKGIVLNNQDVASDSQLPYLVDNIELPLKNLVGQTLWDRLSETTILRLGQSLVRNHGSPKQQINHAASLQSAKSN